MKKLRSRAKLALEIVKRRGLPGLANVAKAAYSLAGRDTCQKGLLPSIIAASIPSGGAWSPAATCAAARMCVWYGYTKKGGDLVISKKRTCEVSVA